MRPFLLPAALAFAFAAAPAVAVSAPSAPGGRRPSHFRWEEWAVVGLGREQYFGTRSEAGASSPKGAYELSARVRSFHSLDVSPGTQLEYSAALKRELYHVTVAGRLGTAPPNAQRAGYHLAQGEVRFALYGLTVGPEHPELSAVVWESSGPVPPPGTLDRTWVGLIRGIYTNTDHHIEEPQSILVVVQNTWQFEFRETWKGRTSLSLQTGGVRYNKVLPNRVQTVFLDNTEYPGNPFALRGWPNNYVAAQAWQRLGEDWKLSAAFTRLNLLDNQMNFLYGGELEWKAAPRWRLTTGYYYNRRRRTATRRGLSLGFSYAW